MLVKKITTADELRREFRNYNRDQYEYETYRGLIEYYEEAVEEDVELDVIAICCDLSEESYEDVVRNYNIEIKSGENMTEAVIEYLNYNTCIIAQTEEMVSYWAF